MPLGKTLSPLLLQRTTVSKHEHSAGQRAKGEQLFSSLPAHTHKEKINHHVNVLIYQKPRIMEFEMSFSM